MIEILKIIGYAFLLCCTLILLFYILKLLASWKKNSETQCSHENIAKQIKELDKLIISSIAVTDQLIVDPLKKQCVFCQQDKEEALSETKNRIKASLDFIDLYCLNSTIGNIDEWINSRIEYFIYKKNYTRKRNYHL